MNRIFKNSMGVYLGRELFFETATTARNYVLYSFKNEDHTFDGVVYPSLRRLYLEEDDPTEFFVAEKYFDGQPHWRRLTAQKWFMDYLTPIREELALKHQAQYMRSLRQDAINGDKVASKYLLDRMEKPKEVGRPTKRKIAEEAQKIVLDNQDIATDFDRMKEFLS